jgi:uncharacterized protein (TIGR03085 family)
LRAGPPLWSPARVPRLRELINGVEFFVHHEDVRRAQPDWQPRDLGRDADDELWRNAVRLGRLFWRRAKVTVEMVRSDTGERRVVVTGGPAAGTAVVSGSPAELVLYLNRRRDHALVERSGSTNALV